MQVGHGEEPLPPAGGQEGGLVHQILQVGAGEAAGGLGDDRQVHILAQGLVPAVDLQDGLPAPDVGQAHVHLTVEPAGAQQGGVQDVHPVGGGHDDDPLVGGKAVHLHQELVQGLLPLVVAAAQAGASLAAHGVDLVDEDDGGAVLLGLVEQVPDPAGAHAHIELHKVRAGDGEEMDSGLAGHGPGQQSLAGARRAHQQHALGDAGPQGDEALGVLEELHDLPEFLLFLVGAGHVAKGDLFIALVGQGAGARPAKPGGFVPAAATAALAEEHKVPHQGEQGEDGQIGYKGHPHRGRGVLGVVVIVQNAQPVLLHQQVVELVVEQLEGVELPGDYVGAVHRLPQREHQIVVGVHRHLGNLLLLQQDPDVGVAGLRAVFHVLQRPQDADQHKDDEAVQHHIAQTDLLQGWTTLPRGPPTAGALQILSSSRRLSRRSARPHRRRA